MEENKVSEPARKEQLGDLGLDDGDEIEGLDETKVTGSWGDYPLNEVLIRHESRTIHDVDRRIKQDGYVMNPDFQRDFIWPEDKQSKLMESVIMRIPLPVFYLAEDERGRMIVVDGLQRLTTFVRFLDDEFRLKLPERNEINGKLFSELPAMYQNRIEDCNLIFYVIDSKLPERARLDIFERVNGGVALTRQQMRNCLFMGNATKFLRRESRTKIFLEATGNSLSTKTMRDREFVNRFCAFQLLGVDRYKGDMDDFLAQCLRYMNKMGDSELEKISQDFRRGLENNYHLFKEHTFRKYTPDQTRRSVLNAALWDVMSTGLCKYETRYVSEYADAVREAIVNLLQNEEFQAAISFGTNGTKQVKTRFNMAHTAIKEVLGAHPD